MAKLCVFADTGALVAMLVFPHDRKGQPTLAGEVLQCYEEGRFELLLSRAVVDELEGVIERDFPEHYRNLVTMFASFEERLTRWPTPGEIQDVKEKNQGTMKGNHYETRRYYRYFQRHWL